MSCVGCCCECLCRSAVRLTGPAWGTLCCTSSIVGSLPTIFCCYCCRETPPTCCPSSDSLDSSTARMYRWSTLWPDADATQVREYLVGKNKFIPPKMPEWSAHYMTHLCACFTLGIFGILSPIFVPCSCPILNEARDDSGSMAVKQSLGIVTEQPSQQSIAKNLGCGQDSSYQELRD